MAKGRIIAALDIGSEKITTLIAQVNTEPVTFETKINIVGVASNPSRGVKKGQIVNIEDTVEATIVSVEAAERMAGYNLDKAFVSVGGGHISSQNSTGVVAVSDPDGEVSAEDVGRVIEAARAISLPASREVIHVLPREFIVDGESGVRDPIGMSGVRLEVDTHLITASAPALKNLSKTIGEVGVQIESLVFSGLASGHATLSDTEKELGCVLIDIGSGTTSAVAFVDGSLAYSGSLPVGSRNVTNDLAIGLRISLESAEKVKVSLSKEIPGKEKKRYEQVEIAEEGTKEVKKVSRRTLTDGIIRPRLNEIFTMVKIDLERAGVINKIPSGAILTGGGALSFGAVDAAKRALSLPTRIANPTGVSGLIDDVISPPFSAAVGLILYGSKVDENKMSPQFPTLPKGIKLPNTASFSKIVDTIRDLLP